MKDRLLLHPRTDQYISRFIADPSHALLLLGPAGTGKSAIMKFIAAQILSIDHKALHKHPYIYRVEPIDNKTITIDAIRQLQRFLTLKIPGPKNGIQRIIIIENAENTSEEAQNALLKTLEEPPVDTLLLMSAESNDTVLPTILSRVTKLPIVIPELESLKNYFQLKGYREHEIEKSIRLSGGLPALTSVLLSSDETHPLYQATQLARQILQEQPYNRLLRVDQLSKQKEEVTQMLYILGQMAHVVLAEQSSAPAAAAQRWQKILEESYRSTQLLRTNSNPKVTLTNLMLAL